MEVKNSRFGRVVYICYVWPEQESSAAGVRSQQLLRFFSDRAEHLWILSAAKNTPREIELPANVTKTAIQLNHFSFDELISEINPSVVIFDRFITEEQYGPRVEANAPSALRIIDTQDIHFLREFRALAPNFKANLPSPSALAQTPEQAPRGEFLKWQRLALREIGSLHRADLSLSLSRAECDWLASTWALGKERIFYFPITYPRERLAAAAPGNSLCFVGNFRHPPNADAIHWLLDWFWPRFSLERPQFELKIAGAYAPDWFAEKLGKAGGRDRRIRFLGHLENLDQLYAGSLFQVVPLRSGAGIKGKILEGWRRGVPALCSPVAAEGLQIPRCEDRGASAAVFPGWIADNPEEFLALALAAALTPNDCANLGRIGKEFIFNELSDANYFSQLEREIAERCQDLPQVRARNIVGQILRLEGLRSQDYFSRWLELKEKLGHESSAHQNSR